MGLTFKNSAVGSYDSSSPASVTTSGTINTAVGDLIVVTLGTNNTATASPNTVTDTAGNTYTARALIGTTRVFWCVATQANSSNYFTGNYTAGDGYAYIDIAVCVFSKDSGEEITVDTSTSNTGYGSGIDTSDLTSNAVDALWMAGVTNTSGRAMSSPDMGSAATAIGTSTNREHLVYLLPGVGQTADFTVTWAGGDTSYSYDFIVFKSNPSINVSDSFTVLEYKEVSSGEAFYSINVADSLTVKEYKSAAGIDAITIGTVYTGSVANGTPGANTWTISDITVPEDATACIFVYLGGYLGPAESVDIANFDGDAHHHFTQIAVGSDPDEATISAYYLLYGQTGFPTRGASGVTFTGSFNTTVEYSASIILVFFLSGTVTDSGTFIVGSEGVNSPTISDGTWTSSDLGDVGASDLAFVGGVQYYNSAMVADPVESGQTAISEGVENSIVGRGFGYEYGEDVLSLGCVNGANYSGFIAFALRAAINIDVSDNFTVKERTPQNFPYFDASSRENTGGGYATITWNHTCSGDDRLLLVWTGKYSDTYPAVISASYNGVAMDIVTHVINGQSCGGHMYLLKLSNPAEGTHQISVTFDTSNYESHSIAMSFRGVEQTTSIENVITNYNGSAGLSVDVNSRPDDLVMSFMSGSGDIACGDTQRVYDYYALGCMNYLGGSTAPGASSVTMDWTTFSCCCMVGANVRAKPDAEPHTINVHEDITVQEYKKTSFVGITGTPVVITGSPQDVTIPADCTAVYLFWAYWYNGVGGLNTATLESISYSAAFEVEGHGEYSSAGVAVWYNPATGANQTLAFTWDNTPTEGPVVLLVFVKGGNLTAWRDADGAHNTSNGVVSATIDSIETDLVLKFDQRYGGAGEYPGISSGWTSNDAYRTWNNSEGARLSICDYPGAVSTVCDSVSLSWSSIIAISIPVAVGEATLSINVHDDLAVQEYKGMNGVPPIEEHFTYSDQDLGDTGNWIERAGSHAISGNKCLVDGTLSSISMATHKTPLNSIEQYGLFTITFGGSADDLSFVFRFSDWTSYYFVVQVESGYTQWIRPYQTSSEDYILSDTTTYSWATGDKIGATIKGTGSNTTLRVWKNPTGTAPDPGGLTWGGVSPGISYTSGTYPVNSGNYAGIYSYVTSGTTITFYDDYYVGDVPLGINVYEDLTAKDDASSSYIYPPAHDDFNRDDANPIGGNWTTATGETDSTDDPIWAIQIQSNQAGAGRYAASPDDSFCMAYWNANVAANDQYSKITRYLGTITNDCWPVVRCRNNEGNLECYTVSTGVGNKYYLSKHVGGHGSYININNGVLLSTVNDGDVWELRAIGTRISLRVNNVEVLAEEDSSVPSGQPGIHLWTYLDVGDRIDNWEGGDLSFSINVSEKFTVQEYKFVNARSYFGQCSITGVPSTDSYSNHSGAHQFSWFYTPFTCPGTGLQAVTELSAYVNIGSDAPAIRLGLYDSFNNLVCQGSALVNVVGPTDHTWQGHMVSADITPATYIIGGQQYYLAIFYDNTGYTNIGYQSGGSAIDYDTGQDYGGGLPNSISRNYNSWYAIALRCGVEASYNLGINVHEDLSVQESKSVNTLTYFGSQDISGGSSTYTAPFSNCNHPSLMPWTCPGIGNQVVKELSGYLKSMGGTPGDMKMALYTTGGALVTQGSDHVTIDNTSFAWRGHGEGMTNALNPANAVITGGSTYVIAISMDTTDTSFGLGAIGSNYYSNLDYTDSDWPATQPMVGGAEWRLALRAGVESGEAGATLNIDIHEDLTVKDNAIAGKGIAVEAVAKGTNQTGSSVTSISTNAVATTTGWTAWVFCRKGEPSGAFSVPTDTAGNTYVAATDYTTGGADSATRSYYCLNITGNANNVVQSNFDSSAWVSVLVVYISGVATSNALEVSDENYAVGPATSITSNQWSTTINDEIVLSGATYDDNVATFTAGNIAGSAGILAVTSGASDTGDSGIIYRILSSTVSNQTATINVSPSQDALVIHTVSFKKAGGEEASLSIDVHDHLDLVTKPGPQPTLTIDRYDSLAVAEYQDKTITVLYVNVYDSTTVAEYQGKLIPALLVNVYDSTRVSESAQTFTPALCITVADSLTAQEATSGFITIYYLNVADNITAQEYKSANTGDVSYYDVSVYDSVRVSEYQDKLLTIYYLSVLDSIGISESQSRVITPLFVSVYDSVGVSESQSRAITPLFVSVSDNVGVSEYQDKLLTIYYLNVYDSAGVSESQSRVITPLYISVYDGVGVQEVAQEFTPALCITVADSLAVQEYQVGYATIYYLNVFEGLSVQEYRTVNTGVESYYDVSVYDRVSVQEYQDKLLTVYYLIVYDPITVQEYRSTPSVTYAVNVSDKLGVSENVDRPQVYLNISVYDKATAQESLNFLIYPYFLTVFEPITVADVKTVNTGLESYYDVSVADNVRVSEFEDGLLTKYYLNVYDSASVQEVAQEFLPALCVIVADSLTVQEATSRFITIYYLNVFEGLSVQEYRSINTGAISYYEVPVYEGFTVQESQTFKVNPYFINVYESVSAQESLEKAITPLFVNVYDSTRVSEYKEQVITPLFVNVYDNTRVSESAQELVPVYLIDTAEAFTALEYQSERLNPYFISSADTFTVSEYSEELLPYLNIYSYDTLRTSEYQGKDVPINVSVRDNLAIIEYANRFSPYCCISVAETFAVPDVFWYTVTFQYLEINKAEKFMVREMAGSYNLGKVVQDFMFDDIEKAYVFETTNRGFKFDTVSREFEFSK